MSLRSKIILALSLVAVLWAMADNLLLHTLVTSHFDEITERTAIDALERAEEELDLRVEGLRQLTEGLAVSPLVRDAALQGDRSQLLQLLDSEALTRAGADLMLLIGPDGRVLRYHARNDEGLDVAYRMFPSEEIAATNPLLKLPEDERFGTILNTEHGFLAVCAYAVPLSGAVPEDLSSIRPLPGGDLAVLIAGRLVPAEVKHESQGHESIVRLTDTGRSELSDMQLRGLELLERAEEVHVVDESDAGGLVSFRCLDDAEGKPTLLLQVELSPDALLEGRRVQQFLALSTFGTSALIFLVLLRLLQRAVIAPLTRLTKHAIEVGSTDDTTRRIGLERDDEIGQLSVEFDRMLDKLEESRRMIVVSARQAGMSEIATGVLHNVGNVLNSVNVSRSLIERKLEGFAVRDLQRTVEVLRSHEGSLAQFIGEDPRGKKLLPFLEELSRSLTAQHGDVVKESENLRKSVDHIADLVRSQQVYAVSRGVFERASLAAEIKSALKISVQAYGADMDIEVELKFEEVPMINVDRHKLMEILINLIQNAKQAMRAAGVRQPKLELILRLRGKDRVEITVADNGEGIPKENLARIFGHGFTTKNDGHGFGLHVSANAATEMGGELKATSDGPGLGAQFTLSFPVDACQLQAAA